MTSLADDLLKVLAKALMPIMQEMIDEAYREERKRAGDDLLKWEAWRCSVRPDMEDRTQAADDSQEGIFKDPLANTEIFFRIGEEDFGVCPLGVILSTWNLFPILDHVSDTLDEGRSFVHMLENEKMLSIKRRS